jgi:hypothetical protein
MKFKFRVKVGKSFDLTIENEKEIERKVKIEKGDTKIEIEEKEKDKNTFLKDINLKKLIFLGVLLAGVYGETTGDYTIFNNLLKTFNNTISMSSKTSKNENTS